MQQQEGLQSAIIRKILLDQSDKASNKMIGYSVVGLVIMMIGIPILLWGQGRARSFVEVLNMMVLIYLLCAIVTTMMLILKIHRADFSEGRTCLSILPTYGNSELCDRFFAVYYGGYLFTYIGSNISFVVLGDAVRPFRWRRCRRCV